MHFPLLLFNAAAGHSFCNCNCNCILARPHLPALSAHHRRQGDDIGPVVPSYCCWEGIRCCHEHSAYMDALRTTCKRYSVSLLELRAGNLSQTMQPIMGDLKTLHEHGLVGIDLSRNFLTGTLPAGLNNLTNLQLLLLGANSE